MRVGIELTALELDRGGTARAIDQLMPLLGQDPDVELVELRHSGSAPTSNLGRIARGFSRELIYMPRTLPANIKKSKLDLLHCPSPLAPPRSAVPMVVTLYDAMGWEHPEWLSRGNVAQLKHRLPKALKAGAHVITSSDYSKQQIAERLKIAEDRISVIPLGLDSRFSATPDPADAELLTNLKIAKPYVLTVGTLQPRKNVEAAIDALERLGDDAGELQLVVAGARGWDDLALIGRVEASPMADRIVLLGRVSDEELLALYRGAECFLFPSLYEGFGFPPLEAMACGTPVISSGRTSLAEAVGDAGIVVDPKNPDEIAEQLGRVLGSPELQSELRTLGIERAATFTWERAASETVAVYRAITAGA